MMHVDPRIVHALIRRDPDTSGADPTMEEAIAFDTWAIDTYGEKIHSSYLNGHLRAWRND